MPSYTLTIVPDAGTASYNISPLKPGLIYEQGDIITVSMAPAEGYFFVRYNTTRAIGVINPPIGQRQDIPVQYFQFRMPGVSVVLVIKTAVQTTRKHVYINNEPYEVYIGDGNSWNRYEPYIGDGSNWKPMQD